MTTTALHSDRRHGLKPSADPRHNSPFTLFVLLIGVFMAILDFFIVNVALPSAQAELHASTAGIQWVVAAYGIALEDLRTGEVVRAMHVELVIRRSGLDPDVSLAELAGSAPGVWSDLLREHRVAMCDLVAEIEQQSVLNRRRLDAVAAGRRTRVPEAVPAALAAAVPAFPDNGSMAEVAYRSALRTNAELSQLSLLAFLR